MPWIDEEHRSYITRNGRVRGEVKQCTAGWRAYEFTTKWITFPNWVKATREEAKAVIRLPLEKNDDTTGD